ncbi:MAG: tetratricopeptide repeat protein [Alphaproteobacteria bacterium]|nr:tetratricopeptide repeat protein [Alphaproteobacteria bacterium]
MFPHKKLDWHTSRLEKQVQDQPDDPELRHELARAYLSRGLYHGGGEVWCNRALTQARKVLGDDPTHVGALITAGTALVGMGRPENGRRYLDEAMRADPERADLHLALGALARSEGDRGLAVRHLETACRLAPDAWEPHLYLGRALAELARARGASPRLVERSQFHLVHALQLGPTPDLTPPLLRDIGLSCLATGRYAEAEKFFIRLREHDRFRSTARFHLGMVAYHLGKYKNAIQHFRQHLQDRAEDPRVYARMAMAYLQLGEHGRAREACNQALLLDPGNRLARYTLGCTLLEEGNPNEAIRVFKEALQEHPDHMEVYLSWPGCGAAGVGDHDGARPGPRRRGPHLRPPAPRRRAGAPPRGHPGADPHPARPAQRRTGRVRCPSSSTPPARVQDEGVRFSIWEAACALANAAIADDVARALQEAGRTFGPELGARAVAAAAALPEPVLTRGLTLSEADIKRAAVDRHGPATDVTAHRQNVEQERQKARAHQALLLLAIAARRSGAGRRLLERWAQTADADLAAAAHAGLAMYGDPDAIRTLSARARRAGSHRRLEALLDSIVPTGDVAPRPVSDQADVHCTACGRTAGQTDHLMAGTDAVICDVCVIEVSRNRRAHPAPDDARCAFCSKTQLESRGVYRFEGVDICASCLDLSLGLMEREQVDRFLAAW